MRPAPPDEGLTISLCSPFDNTRGEAERYHRGMKLAHKRASKNIQTLLTRNGISVRKLARETGIDVSNISKMLHGQRQINLDHLTEIAKVLDVDVQKLLEP